MAGLADSRRWQVLPRDEVAEERLVHDMGIAPLVARVLVARGITNPSDVHTFLTPSLERDWADPLRIPGMQQAAERICRAIYEGETIAVFGDFDVDGMSAASLLVLGLRELGATAQAFIPDRFAEGYGLSEVALKRVVQTCHPQLVVTVDNGIAAGKEVKTLLAQGIDVVVTDHHEPSDLVPEGIPVVDPKLEAEGVSRDLAGAGVALKLVCELGRRLGQPDLWRSLTELACLGTISDMMVLQGENRALVTEGISCMRQSTRPGIVALAAAAGVDLSQITADELPFSLIPRLNAAGRMGSVDVAFRLLSTDDVHEATRLAARLEQINNERRETETALADQALAHVDISERDRRVMVVAGEGWHEGVKGIVASRLVSRFHVPAIVFSVADGLARGSGRSVGSVDLFHAVEQCADLTVRFGGHAGAVGVTVPAEGVDAFAQRLEEVLMALPSEQFESSDEVTALVRLEELNAEAIDALEVLQPFGQGNKKPLVGVCGITMHNRARAGALGNHLRFVASDGFAQIPAIMFRVPDVERAAVTDGVVDLVCEAVNETWQSRTKPKLMVKDILYRACDSSVTPFEELRDDACAADGQKLRNELAQLSYHELTDTLAHLLIGDHELLPAQEASLSRLEQGKSTFLVMATGRGKSLVFHVHAAREAIAHHRASVFVYPLRALVNDQSHHITDFLASVGVQTCVLTGETTPSDRATAWKALATGSCDVVLTTPEFLAIHHDAFAATRRWGFLVIDEAHHVVEAASTRPSYAALPQLSAELQAPPVLAVTATATERIARSVQDLLDIPDEGIIVDASQRDNLQLRDCRDLRDRDDAVAHLVSVSKKCIVYVNSRGETVSLVRMLRHTVREKANSIAYYNAGLPSDQRRRVERAFRDGRLSCIVSTSAFGEGVNVADVRDVVLYHLPFGQTEFNQMSGRVGRDGAPARIWLLFSARDASINERILTAASPTRDELISLWRTLRVLSHETRDGMITLDDEQIARALPRVDRRCFLDTQSVSSGIAVFSELGFLTITRSAEQRLMRMVDAPQHMHLEDSARYAEGLREIEDFAAFRDWVLESSPTELLLSINRPIVPDHGRVVDDG